MERNCYHCMLWIPVNPEDSTRRDIDFSEGHLYTTPGILGTCKTAESKKARLKNRKPNVPYVTRGHHHCNIKHTGKLGFIPHAYLNLNLKK